MGSSSDPSRAEDSSDVEEENIPESHLAAQLRYCFSLRMGQSARLRILKQTKKSRLCAAGIPSLPDLISTNYRRSQYTNPPTTPSPPSNKRSGSGEPVCGSTGP